MWTQDENIHTHYIPLKTPGVNPVPLHTYFSCNWLKLVKSLDNLTKYICYVPALMPIHLICPVKTYDHFTPYCS